MLDVSSVLLYAFVCFVCSSRFMSGEDQKFSSPVAPAGKTIYGSCAGDWHVTSLKGNVTSIKQECSDGTSHIYEASTVNWKTHDARRKCSAIEEIKSKLLEQM